MIDGYILLTLLPYQLAKLLLRPKNNVKPEQKKNKASPIAPPVTNPSNLGNSNFMCEYVISKAAKNLSSTTALFLPSRL